MNERRDAVYVAADRRIPANERMECDGANLKQVTMHQKKIVNGHVRRDITLENRIPTDGGNFVYLGEVRPSSFNNRYAARFSRPATASHDSELREVLSVSGSAVFVCMQCSEWSEFQFTDALTMVSMLAEVAERLL